MIFLIINILFAETTPSNQSVPTTSATGEASSWKEETRVEFGKNRIRRVNEMIYSRDSIIRISYLSGLTSRLYYVPYTPDRKTQ